MWHSSWLYTRGIDSCHCRSYHGFDAISFQKDSRGKQTGRSDKWKTIFGPYEFLGTDLYQKTLGIFGMGRIGKAVAKRATGFEMKVVYHNRTRLSKKEEENRRVRYVSLDDSF